MLSTAHVGRRVVVRHRLPPTIDGTPGGPQFTDVLGILESWTDGVVAVRRAEGELIEIHERDIVAGKQVPPRPPRRIRPGTQAAGAQLAVITSAGWPAVDRVPLGEWELRAADGFTGRANSTLVTGSPGIPLDDALAAVRAFYRARDLPAWAQVIVDSPYEAELLRRGWTVVRSGPAGSGHETVLVRVGELAAVTRRLNRPAATDEVELTATLSDEWYARYRDGGSPTPVARHVLTGADATGRGEVRLAAIGQPPTAIGRGVVTRQWLGLSAIEVEPAMRRRGLARAVLAALVEWGTSRDARWAYVQVGADNGPALALYDQLGFRTDHAYRYYAAPGDES